MRWLKSRSNEKTPGVRGFVLHEQRPLCRLFVGDDLDVVVSASVPLIIGQHDGDAINKRLVLQGDGGALPALVGPDRANARPDFLAALVFAGGLAVVDEMSRCVWHILSV